MSHMLPIEEKPTPLRKALDWGMFGLGALTLAIAVTATVANSLEGNGSAYLEEIEVTVLPEAS